MKDRIGLIAFIVSACFLAVIYGTWAGRQNKFPNPEISLALDTLTELKNIRNDLQLSPTRHLVPADRTRMPDAVDGFAMYRPDLAEPGYTLVAGLSKNQDKGAFEVVLYDGDGQTVHTWPVDFKMLSPDGPKPLNTMLHGMEVLADGSIAVAFDAGHTIARLDMCGQPIWSKTGDFHHSITADGQGGLYTWEAETIKRLDQDTGEETFSLDLRNEIIPAGDGQEGIFLVRSFIQGIGESLSYASDPFHANDVEMLRPDMAAAFPMFEAGDLMISLREINLVAVVSPTGELRWWQHGPWLKQHDPDFEADGTITVFDNNSGSGRSRILNIDPKTNITTIAYEGTPEHPFYNWQRGKQQQLPNGNILVTEAQKGRVFEFAPGGELVWEREAEWDETQNLIVTEARHVGPDFFTDGVPACELTTASVR